MLTKFLMLPLAALLIAAAPAPVAPVEPSIAPSPEIVANPANHWFLELSNGGCQAFCFSSKRTASAVRRDFRSCQLPDPIRSTKRTHAAIDRSNLAFSDEQRERIALLGTSTTADGKHGWPIARDLIPTADRKPRRPSDWLS